MAGTGKRAWYGNFMASNARKLLGVKVFAATKGREREFLGETITDWIRTHLDCEVFDKIVTQSSDREFHCVTVTFFYRERVAEAG